ncbi:MAG TPA: alpha/beta fold hydrolase, partial [Pyrinomonadaceae bacterium]|nr:alpha/beta fold hydrolase [Pyrinomonadaceae bacterium]
MINRPAIRFYEFGIFRVDVTERVLYKESREVPLTPKVFDTLVLLLENGSRVLTKKELMQKIWPDSFVEENNLAQNISILRKALDQQAGRNGYIQTIPKRGYRFIADVRTDSGDEANPTIRTAPFELRTSKHPPETMYARSGEVNIAYQVIGDGPLDLVFVMGWVSHMEYFWREPNFSRFLLRLASFSRLILFDKRGTGLSDRVPIAQLPTLEQRMDDVRAVMDAVGSKRAALCGVSEGGPMCSLFAATYPEKTVALVMIGTYAKRIRDDDYPWAPTTAERQHFFQEMQEQWGGPVGLEERAPS